MVSKAHKAFLLVLGLSCKVVRYQSESSFKIPLIISAKKFCINKTRYMLIGHHGLYN